MAKVIGSPRIVKGYNVSTPSSNPRLSEKDEKEFREKLVLRALEALATNVKDQLVLV